MVVGVVIGVNVHQYWFGLGLGVLAAFLVAQGKHKGRGVLGFVIALLLVGTPLLVYCSLLDANDAEHMAAERSYRMRY